MVSILGASLVVDASLALVYLLEIDALLALPYDVYVLYALLVLTLRRPIVPRWEPISSVIARNRAKSRPRSFVT